MKKCFIYLLKDPISHSVRYIGKANDLKKRYSQHISSSKKEGKTYVKHWIKTLLAQNIKPIMEKIEEIEYSLWEQRESFWIEFYKNKGCDLCNLTSGGEGLTECSEQTKTKLRESNKRNIAKYQTPEFKSKISELSKKSVRTQEHCDKISQSKKGKKLSKETILKISESKKGKRAVSDEKYKEIAKVTAPFLKKANEKRQKKVYQYSLEKEFIKEWESISVFCQYYSINRDMFRRYVNKNKLFHNTYLSFT